MKVSDRLYKWYKEMREKINRMENESEETKVEMAEFIAEWQEVIDAIEKSTPDIKRAYERNKAVQESFSRDQIDFICYQIGDWYMDWQDKMWVDNKPNQHWLGFAKEQLKTMICGE